MKKLKIGTLISLVGALVLLTGVSASADEFTNVGSLYDKAVSENIIDPGLYSKNQWEKDESTKMRPSYEVFKKEVSEETSYAEWLKLNNYGVMSDTKQPILQEKTKEEQNPNPYLRSQQDNINRFCRDTKAGDILVIYGNTQHGISSMLGHAAILSADGFVLEMPGGGRDNNRQWNKRDWISSHIKEWTAVYRVSNNNLARQVAHYADTHFYSTTGGYTKNIHLDYGIDFRIKRINPNYCSKLVWQAYYYGSGSLPVIRETGDAAIIPPANLFSSFTSSYTPKYIGKY